MLHICAERVYRCRNLNKYGRFEDSVDIINYAKFEVDWWRGVNISRVENSI